MVSDAFFTTPDGDWFQPTGACRGPWDPDACHAGPPAGLLARALEKLVPHQPLVRLTVDLIRPIPHAGFRVEARLLREGRTVSTTALAVVDGEGREVVTARAMHLVAGGVGVLPTAPADTPDLALARQGRFGLEGAGHGLEMFSDGIEVRYPPGDGPDPGPTRIWMRTLPLLPDEEPSPVQRICPLADCGNAVSRNAEPTEVAFVNTDLTIALHRAPVGEWLGAEAVSHWQDTGVGLADALLFDGRGPVGRALQSLVLRPTGR